MKTLQQNHISLINRINHLSIQSKSRSSRISLSQMLTHCIAVLQVTAAHQFSPESFADQILKAITKSASSKHGSINEEKQKLVDCIQQQADNGDAGIYQNIEKFLQQFNL